MVDLIATACIAVAYRSGIVGQADTPARSGSIGRFLASPSA